MDARIFPTILIVLNFAAAAVCMSHGDVRKTIYWIAAGILSITVTW